MTWTRNWTYLEGRSVRGKTHPCGFPLPKCLAEHTPHLVSPTLYHRWSGGGKGGEGKLSAFQEFLWCFEEGSGPSTLTPEEDDTGVTRVLNFKLTLHSIYAIGNLKFFLYKVI